MMDGLFSLTVRKLEGKEEKALAKKRNDLWGEFYIRNHEVPRRSIIFVLPF